MARDFATFAALHVPGDRWMARLTEMAREAIG